MPRAILKNGVIYPVDPLPAEWVDGQDLLVEAVQPDPPPADDLWLEALDAMVACNDPEDLARLEAALREADEIAKAQVRRDMGLP